MTIIMYCGTCDTEYEIDLDTGNVQYDYNAGDDDEMHPAWQNVECKNCGTSHAILIKET